MWKLKPTTKGKKVLKISQTLKNACLIKKNTKGKPNLKKKKKSKL